MIYQETIPAPSRPFQVTSSYVCHLLALPASSPKFLALSHSLLSCTEKLMVSPSNTHVPFTPPAHYGELLLLWGCDARCSPCPADQHAGFPSSLFRSHSLHSTHQAEMPAGSPPPNPLPTACLPFSPQHLSWHPEPANAITHPPSSTHASHFPSTEQPPLHHHPRSL